ncbi:MAG: DUF996 domain-containing protein [Euryarchaeota archaeon]|nr:DUF996 domain-containing protein [Euryarchaeota archaeon]
MTADVSTIRILGGLGGILAALSFIHWVVGLVGVILLLVAFYMSSEYYQEGMIFSNAIKYLVFSIVAIAVIFGTMMYTALRVFKWTLWTPMMGNRSEIIKEISRIPQQELYGILSILIVGVIVGVALLIVSAVFLKRASDLMARVSGVNLFSTAGLLYLIGAVLVIIVGVGIILILIAYLLLGISFLMIKEKPQEYTGMTVKY